METCLDRLQTQMMNSDPLTNEEIVEQEVFKNAYIPKNLNEVYKLLHDKLIFLSKFSEQFYNENRLLILKGISV